MCTARGVYCVHAQAMPCSSIKNLNYLLNVISLAKNACIYRLLNMPPFFFLIFCLFLAIFVSVSLLLISLAMHATDLIISIVVVHECDCQ